MQRNISVVPVDVARTQRCSERTCEAGVGHRGHRRVGMEEGLRLRLGKWGAGLEACGVGNERYNPISGLSCSSPWRSTRARSIRSIARTALPASTMATQPCFH